MGVISGGFQGLKALLTPSYPTTASGIVNMATPYANQVGVDARQIWAREDSAYQRMVKDMQKAGLNPWTALGSGGSPTSATNPSLDSLTGLLNVLNTAIGSQNAATNTYKAYTNFGLGIGKLANQTINSISGLISNISSM